IGRILSCLEVEIPDFPIQRCEAIHSLSLCFTQRYDRVLIFLLLLPCRFMSLDSTSPVPINSYGTTCFVAPGFEAWFYSACTIHYGKFLNRHVFARGLFISSAGFGFRRLFLTRRLWV
ncbi:unnamed protein product, partial [Brassica oleracea]